MDSSGSGMNTVLPLLEEYEQLPSKKYVIFDQTGNSRRILFYPHLRDPGSFHKVVALGIAAFESAKASRATSLPLAPVDLSWEWGEKESWRVNSGSHNVNSYESEDSEELDALLYSDKEEEEEEEVTSTVTFNASEEPWCFNAASNEVDQFENKRKRRICKADEDDEGESNLQKRRRCNADEDGDGVLEEELGASFIFPHGKCRNAGRTG